MKADFQNMKAVNLCTGDAFAGFDIAVKVGMCQSQLKAESVRFGFCISNLSNSDANLSQDHS